jgi:hypothetical protein
MWRVILGSRRTTVGPIPGVLAGALTGLALAILADRGLGFRLVLLGAFPAMLLGIVALSMVWLIAQYGWYGFLGTLRDIGIAGIIGALLFWRAVGPVDVPGEVQAGWASITGFGLAGALAGLLIGRRAHAPVTGAAIALAIGIAATVGSCFTLGVTDTIFYIIAHPTGINILAYVASTVWALGLFFTIGSTGAAVIAFAISKPMVLAGFLTQTCEPGIVRMLQSLTSGGSHVYRGFYHRLVHSCR